MAVVSAPLLSFGAAGQIGKSLVFATWKGRPYARRLVTPANPRTTQQMETRDAFTFLNATWRLAPANVQAPWAAFAQSQVMFDRNAWIKKNLPIIRGNLDLAGFQLSPGAKGGLNVTPMIVGGVATITLTATAPTPLPSGWSVVAFVGAAILDQDPAAATDVEIVSGEDLTASYSVVLSGLAAGDYRAAGWFVYQRSASITDLAYGAGDTTAVTVT